MTERSSQGVEDTEGLEKRLSLTADGRDRFRWPGRLGDGHIFGGLLAAQSLRAAGATVGADRPPHSIHCHFLRSGDGRRPVLYEVERTRDGGSFSTRRVVAAQEGAPLLVATASFQVPEPGATYETPGPRRVPGPEDLPPGRYTSPWFDSRDIPEDADVAGAAPHSRLAWFRLRHRLPEDPALHAQAIVYLSDHGATRAVRQPHIAHPAVEQRMSVSLDHSVWLHVPARADGWILTEFHPVATAAGRGLALGSVRAADGRLLASVTQEALLRLPDG